MRYSLLASVLTMVLLSGCIPSGERSEADIQKIVIDTIQKKPEIIVEALTAYQKQIEAKQNESKTTMVEQNKDKIFNDSHSLVLGNKQGDVTIVAFKDYRCGYCKRAWESLKELLAQDKNIKLVIKELPILGPESRLAADYAFASEKQGKHDILFKELMEHAGPWDTETLDAIAAHVGLDVKKLTQDRQATEIDGYIDQNLELSHALGIQGTPAFVIGKQFFGGAISLDDFKKVIAEERQANQ